MLIHLAHISSWIHFTHETFFPTTHKPSRVTFYLPWNSYPARFTRAPLWYLPFRMSMLHFSNLLKPKICEPIEVEPIVLKPQALQDIFHGWSPSGCQVVIPISLWTYFVIQSDSSLWESFIKLFKPLPIDLSQEPIGWSPFDLQAIRLPR